MTEINDVTSLTKSVNRIAKALDQDFSKESLTESLDAIADYIEENGTGGGSSAEPLIINVSGDEEREATIMDKTWKEIKDAFVSGKLCLVNLSNSSNYITYCYINKVSGGSDGNYGVSVGSNQGSYSATSENDYPYMGW